MSDISDAEDLAVRITDQFRLLGLLGDALKKLGSIELATKELNQAHQLAVTQTAQARKALGDVSTALDIAKTDFEKVVEANAEEAAKIIGDANAKADLIVEGATSQSQEIVASAKARANEIDQGTNEAKAQANTVLTGLRKDIEEAQQSLAEITTVRDAALAQMSELKSAAQKIVGQG